MKRLMLFLFLFVTSLCNAQCTQCGGSRVDVSFTTATQRDTNGNISTITGNFVYIMDFARNRCKFIKDGVLQWEVELLCFGIFQKDKYFQAGWNSEKNKGWLPSKVTIDLRNASKSFSYENNTMRDEDDRFKITAIDPIFVKY